LSRLRRPAPALAAWALLAVGLLVLLRIWQGEAYGEYSDGVYALTGRLVLEGSALYRDVAAAQPPPVYYVGAGLLALFGDSVDGLRSGLAVAELATSLLVFVCVWRLTRSQAAAVVAALVALVTPWALREHAQLVPETLAAPLVLGAALAGSRSGRAGTTAAGVLAALAAACKLAFVLPAVALLLAARRRGRALLSFVVTGSVLAAGFLLAFGEPLLDGAVRAQRQTGTAGLHYVGGLWAQAGWNLLPLLACAALAWPTRRAVADVGLLRSVAAAALGSLLLLATLFKHGSYLTVVVVMEPPLLCLAAVGVTAAVRQRALLRLALAAAAGALGVLQVGSLLASPGDPTLFTRPLAASGPGWTMSPSELDGAVAALRACPAGVAASGPPYLAFVAGRRIAGDQPDQFIVEHAAVLARFRALAERDQPRCR
jgi:Dolichyl-phosphate-mannose-protein mannosyltransferase